MSEKITKRILTERQSRKNHKNLNIDEEYQEMNEEEYFLNKYNLIKAEYIECNLSSTIISILSKAIQKSLLSNSDEMKRFMKQLISIAKDFALNEMEASLWTIYLQKLNWKSDSNANSLELIYTAYASKSTLNKKLDPFKAYLKNKSKKFLKNYEIWYNSHKKNFNISMKEINIRFNEYSKPYLGVDEVSITDYNTCVNEILQIVGDPREEDTQESEIKKQASITREVPLIEITREMEESIPLANPVLLLDSMSPNLLEENSKEKSPRSFGLFANQNSALQSLSSDISEFDLFNEESHESRVVSRNSPNASDENPTNFVLNRINPINREKTDFEEGFSKFN